MRNRLKQPGIVTYRLMESVLLAACTKQDFTEHLAQLSAVYSDELNVDRLILQLHMLSDLFPGPGVTNVSDLITLFKQKPQEIRQLFGDIERLMKLLLVLPVSSATAERSFSCLRRLKTYLRSTMSQRRLNHVALLHVHKDLVDQLNLSTIQSSFGNANDHRRFVFDISNWPTRVDLTNRPNSNISATRWVGTNRIHGKKCMISRQNF
jgi:hypothetical protein